MEEEQRNESEQDVGGHGTALKAAAAAAATGAAAYAVRKAMSGSDGSSDSPNGKQREKGGASNSLIASVASGGWDAARDAIVPLAEDAAAAAGKYLAQSSPDFVRERIVPRFIASFNESSGND